MTEADEETLDLVQIHDDVRLRRAIAQIEQERDDALEALKKLRQRLDRALEENEILHAIRGTGANGLASEEDDP